MQPGASHCPSLGLNALISNARIARTEQTSGCQGDGGRGEERTESLGLVEADYHIQGG